MKRFCMVLCLTAIGLSLVWSADAAAPAKVSEVAAIEDLVEEAKARVEKLVASVASDEAFKKAVEDKTIGQDAGVLAVVAQGIAEHDQGKQAGIAAATLRDAALSIRRAQDLAAAKPAVETAQAALGGKGDSATTEHPWNKLTGMHAMMEEINARQAKLRRALARPRELKKDSQHAAIIAVLSLAMEEDTHEVKNPSDIPQWKAWSKEYRVTMSQIAAEMKAGNADKAKELFNGSGRACNACHEKFRDQ